MVWILSIIFFSVGLGMTVGDGGDPIVAVGMFVISGLFSIASKISDLSDAVKGGENNE